MLEFDEAASRRVEATYLTRDIVDQRRVFIEALGLEPGEKVLDIGAGPGLLAADMAPALGPEGAVLGIEPSESMRALAAHREAAPGAAPMTFRDGDALALALEDESFDVAVSTQVYEYIADIETALSEAHRVLRPGGRLAILDTDWDSLVWHATDAARARRVLAAWDEHLVDPHLPRRLSPLLRAAGFTVIHHAAFAILNAGYDTNTYSANVIDTVAAFVAGRHGITDDDAKAWADDLVALGDDYFFSITRYLFVATRQ